jgi:hypothetical protein
VVKGTFYLPDGGKLGFASYVSASGAIPVGGVIKAKATAISGTLAFHNIPKVSDLDGEITWLKSAGQPLTDTQYPTPFLTRLPAVGSKYNPLTVAPALFSGSTTATVVSECSVVSGTATNTVTLLPGGKTVVSSPLPDPHGLKLSFKVASGLFSGSFLDAVGMTRKFNGVLLQKQSKGAGFFLGKDAAGNGFSGSTRVDAGAP